MEHNPKCMLMVLLVAALVNGCKRDDDPITPMVPTNEEELITTLDLHFHSANDIEHKHFTFTDLDGDGGSAPIIEADTLSIDSIYSVEIEVLNASGSPVEDITAEIQAESAAHQFFFRPSGANVTVAYADTDANGFPVGLQSVWSMGGASNGTIVVTLRHQPDKTAAGVSDGDITNAGGETDIEVTFPVVIE